jgi:cell division septation protein DedD
VQLGSFASRVTADRMVKDLSQQGQSAFVMPVKSGNSTLYRVRIGPFAERAVANESLREVKGRIANAAVVAHP